MTKLRRLLSGAAICLLAGGLAMAGSPKPTREVHAAAPVACIEVTQTDFLAAGKVDASLLCTFGMRLGQSMREAQEALYPFEGRNDLISKPNSDLDAGVFSVQVCDSAGRNYAAAFLKDGVVTRIEWYEMMRDFLVGTSRQLVDLQMGDRNSELRLSILGREDAASITAQSFTFTSSIYTTFLYDKEGLRIVKTHCDGDPRFIPVTDWVYVQLVKPARVR